MWLISFNVRLCENSVLTKRDTLSLNRIIYSLLKVFAEKMIFRDFSHALTFPAYTKFRRSRNFGERSEPYMLCCPSALAPSKRSWRRVARSPLASSFSHLFKANSYILNQNINRFCVFNQTKKFFLTCPIGSSFSFINSSIFFFKN